MKKIIYSLIGSIIGLILYGCPQFGEPIGDSTLTIVNNSDKTIHFYIDLDKAVKDYNPFDHPNEKPLLPYKTEIIYSWWKASLNQYHTHYLFFYDKAVVDSVPWDTIRVHNMFLTRIEFTKQILDSLNWTLTYP